MWTRSQALHYINPDIDSSLVAFCFNTFGPRCYFLNWTFYTHGICALTKNWANSRSRSSSQNLSTLSNSLNFWKAKAFTQWLTKIWVHSIFAQIAMLKNLVLLKMSCFRVVPSIMDSSYLTFFSMATGQQSFWNLDDGFQIFLDKSDVNLSDFERWARAEKCPKFWVHSRSSLTILKLSALTHRSRKSERTHWAALIWVRSQMPCS